MYIWYASTCRHEADSANSQARFIHIKLMPAFMPWECGLNHHFGFLYQLGSILSRDKDAKKIFRKLCKENPISRGTCGVDVQQLPISARRDRSNALHPPWHISIPDMHLCILYNPVKTSMHLPEQNNSTSPYIRLHLLQGKKRMRPFIRASTSAEGWYRINFCVVEL